MNQSKLKKLLSYNPDTGIFIWKEVSKYSSKAKIGDKAGTINNGYIYIRINGKGYGAHRLAVLYMKGYWPEHGVDHKDRIRHHNWWDNLRESGQQCNSRNVGNSKANKSNIKGVIWHKRMSKWMAFIVIDKVDKHIGYHTTKEEAACHRLAAEQCINWARCDVNSPAFVYVKTLINKEKKNG